MLIIAIDEGDIFSFISHKTLINNKKGWDGPSEYCPHYHPKNY